MKSLLHRSLTCLVLCLSAAACGPTLRIKPGEVPPVQMPPPELRAEAEGYVASYIDESNYKEIKSGPELSRVKVMVDRLGRAAGYPANAFPVHLADAGDEVNAAAFNGASVLVYKELLDKVSSDDELATVLGHEVGHIVAKHYTDKEEEEARASAVGIGSSILGSAASIATSVAGLGGVSNLAGDVTETTAGVVGYGAFVGSFNRTQEYEADHLGLLIMARAGYDPRAAPAFWNRAEEVFGASDSTVGAFFSTHPASGDRMDALNEAMPFAIAEYEKSKAGKSSAATAQPVTTPAKSTKGKKQKSA